MTADNGSAIDTLARDLLLLVKAEDLEKSTAILRQRGHTLT